MPRLVVHKTLPTVAWGGMFAVLLMLLSCDAILAADALPPASTEEVDFARDVRPIFEQACFSCHGPDKQRSSFRLDLRTAALKGGDFGAAILPGQSAESPLIRFVAGLEEGMEMPPEGDRLTAAQIAILRRWIEDGAPWPDALAGDDSASARAWWSLQPIANPTIPTLEAADRNWGRTPIDAFILAKLREEGLSPAPEADRRTLIRRLTVDLHGLPPTPQEIRDFVEDADPLAYERLVDRLLDSERYGERWARHWLDVAHYADSHGHDQDRPRPNAWPYRDYLIRALNADQPYARFVTDQVAGDALHPDDAASIAATGFLAAGPFDESSLVSIQEDSIDRLIGQYLDRDDIVTNVMSTFCALTVGCARCHDHKFDPISQQDYYSLQAVFSGIDKAERRYDIDPAVRTRRTNLQRQLKDVQSWKDTLEPALLTEDRRAAAAVFESQRAAAESSWEILEPKQWQARSGSILKALLDRSILAVGARPDSDTYVVTAETRRASVTGLKLEVLLDETLPNQGPGRADNGNLHLNEVRVKAHPPGRPEQSIEVKLRRAVADFDQANWEISKAIDGVAATAWGIDPQEGKPHEAVFEFETPVALAEGAVFVIELEQSHGRGHLIGRFRLSTTDSTEVDVLPPLPAAITEIVRTPASARTEPQVAALSQYLWQQQLEHELASLPVQDRVFCGTNQFVADGTFRPAAAPRPVHVLIRGDVLRPGAAAVPGTIEVLSDVAPYQLAEPDQEAARRAALADWLTSRENPLTWRVIVNRVWHYHFGRGLVDTPNDFGRMGGLPSHPELLDWLAVHFRDQGGSLKALHRLIVTSSAYRQQNTANPEAAEKDADNRLLWRMNRRRLDAESVRDAVLLVSGRLDDAMYGPPVMHFQIRPGPHITPDADYDAFDVDSPESRRRSIYRFVLRTRPDPLLEVLDCPDASQSAPVRSDSVSALQALALWNDKFTLRHAEHLAELAATKSTDRGEQVRFAAERVLGRLPTEDEQTVWRSYAEKFGVANLCRVLLNSSEFLFVD